MDVTELRPGLWRWTAPHPAWIEGADWPREVGCVYYEAPGAVVLIDPLVPPEREGFFRALDRDFERADRPLAILLTVPWHERSAEEVAERYGTALDGLPRGIVPLSFPEVGETIYWLPEHGALVPGDTLVGEGQGGLVVCPDTRLEGDSAVLRQSLRSLLELPIELVLVSHGEPVLANGHVALARALRA